MNSLADWLVEELKARSWSHNELARRSGMSQAAVSAVIAGHRTPGCEFCVKVAAALEVSPVLVLTIAGILPPQPPGSPDDHPAIAELLNLARKLPPADLEEIVALIRFKLSRR